MPPRLKHQLYGDTPVGMNHFDFHIEGTAATFEALVAAGIPKPAECFTDRPFAEYRPGHGPGRQLVRPLGTRLRRAVTAVRRHRFPNLDQTFISRPGRSRDRGQHPCEQLPEPPGSDQSASRLTAPAVMPSM